jgi:hypothetical protein
MKLELLISVGTTLVLVGIAWGTLSARLDAAQTQIVRQQGDISALYQWRDSARLDGLAERVNSAADRALRADATATKLLDRELSRCRQEE